MNRERVLITVKTYPTLSTSHVELVCTAGLREDGSWIRIYPIPFRRLDNKNKFPKWNWVELPLIKRIKDKRPESFSPTNLDDISVQESLSTSHGWRDRKRILFKKETRWTNLTALIEEGKTKGISLATFKPSSMVGLEITKSEANWDESKLASVKAQLQQGDLLDQRTFNETFKIAKKLPYDFYYKFRDENDKMSRLRILDWEIGMLFWNCRKNTKSDEEALVKVRQKYESSFFDTDLHLILGTTLEWHDRSHNPWVIIGVVPLPYQNQQELFENL